MATTFEAIAAWLLLVLVTSIVVVYLALRWGRDPFGWVLLSAVMGPIALVALIATRQRDIERPSGFGVRETVQEGSRAVTIVAACDGSAATERIAQYLAGEAAGEVVAMLTVLPKEAEPRKNDDPTARADREKSVERATATAEAALRSAGIETCVVVGYGVPGEEIVRYAQESDARLVVVGRRGSGMARALLGSVADYVVRHAGRPVLVID
jgi:nucleotide-binding universal stress UspA family protein